MTAFEVLAKIKESTWTGGNFGLDGMTSLMAYLGHPEKKLRYVHVTGTNGKGSVSSLLQETLRHAGYHVGFFSSPPLFSFSEQIKVGQTDIPMDAIGTLGTYILEVCQNMIQDGLPHPSEFEFTFALALLYFIEEKVELAVVEVGLGGRLDATNVIPSPEVAVFTAISLEHCAILGDTVPSIAKEKGGIIKEGCHVVLYAQAPDVTSVISQLCEEKNVPLTLSNPSAITLLTETIHEQTFEVLGHCYSLPLLGAHQRNNFAVVLATLDVLRGCGFSTTVTHLQSACQRIQWAGRCEVVQEKPLILLDGGHNPQGVAALVTTIRSLFPNQSFLFILGMLRDKPYDEMLSLLLPVAKEIVTLTPPNVRGLPAVELAKTIESMSSCPVTALHSVSDALSWVAQKATDDDVVVGLGSLYLIGELRHALLPQNQPKNLS